MIPRKYISPLSNLLLSGLLFAGFVVVFPVFALTSPPLTLKGQSAENAPIEVRLTQDDIASLPQESITTSMPWVNGKATFSGVNLQALLNHYQLKPGTIHLTALNQFTAELNWQDMKKYQPVLAIRHNDEWMRVRDYGPFWLIFALDTHPDLIDKGFLEKMVWQINEINVVP
ncbi:oxidoreductase [Photobacterium sp. SP02]|uniref:oxidoreductase n=1 Tax=Photobacterium sp. SP02 TaxID=3032280 RepID=UPI003144D395